MVLEFELDSQAKALCLAWALGNLRDKCRDLERPFPFSEELRLVHFVMEGGHMGTEIANGVVDGHTRRDELPAFFTQKAFAAAIGKSPRTVRRMERRGQVRRTAAGIPSDELRRLKGAA